MSRARPTERLARRDRSHAARVAAVATLVVIALYVIGAIVLNVIVTNRLTNEIDARLLDRLAHLDVALPSAPPASGERAMPLEGNDIDDAPSFFWKVHRDGTVTPLTAGAPALPNRQWSTAPLTAQVGATPFRFVTRQVGSDLVVAGQSAAEIPRVRSAFIVPEIVLGAILLCAVFAGAFIIGLRASAPLEMVRRRQAEFTADASHELRTPLSVIEAEVDLALRANRDPVKDAAVLGRIAGEGRRLRRVVEDLLWLARSDGLLPERARGTTCDLGAVVTGCAERFRAVSEARGVALDVDVSGGAFFVVAAAEDVDRLVGVLVDNACRYAGAGGRVGVRVRAVGSRVSLEVDDSGSGIADDDVPYIFDRFHRATESPGGTGLGLAIADAVVRSSRGSWTVGQSRLGGAHMGVSWRRLRRPTVAGTRPPTPGPPAGPRSGPGEDAAIRP
jgi:signal transduction histidine kinase